MKKVVGIIGSCGKIGSSLAEKLLITGYKVILVDINKRELLNLKKKLNSRNVEVFNTDIIKKKNIDNFIKFGEKKFQKIDAVVNCSYPKSKGWGTNFENIKENFLKEDLFNQLGSTIILCQRVTKYFLKVKGGNLILISSIMGVQSPKFELYKNTKMTSPIEYSAIKSGVISITKYLSKYYKNKNIRINCISAGGINDNQPALFKKKYKNLCNSKGLLDGKDVSNLIQFLLSEESKFINGQNLIIDDGWTS